jgi:hypothetical protein
MLYLHPPFFSYEGVVVGRDYSDPSQFWYFPDRPKLATDEHGRPAIRFLVYKEDLSEIAGGEDVGAGFLFFDTVLSWPEETLKKVAARLRQDLDLNEEPRLAPLLYTAGKVKLIFLDRVSAAPGSPPGGDPPPSEDWVTVLESAGTPSLYGENRAIFSVALTKKAAALLLGSFDGFVPAGVVYELTYVAMQRAFEVTVDVDWELAYDYVRHYDEQRVLFFSNESEQIVEKLVEKKIIKITGSLEGVGDEAMQGEFDEVRKQLSQFVFEKFFEPKVNPKELLDKDVPGGILALLGGLRTVGKPINFGCAKRELSTEQIRQLNVDYTISRAVERTIAPQGHLSVFWSDFAPQITKADVVTVVSGDADIWRQVDFRVLASAAFAADAVERIVVDVAYGQMDGGQPAASAKRYSVVLDSGHSEGSVRGWYDPAVGTSVHYRFTVAMGPKAAVGDGVVLSSPWRPATGVVTVNPLELYRERRVEFQRSALLPAALFPEVLVHARYLEPASGWIYRDSGLLKDGAPTWRLVFRIPAGAPARADYRCEYQRDGEPVDGGWQSTDESLVLIGDPRKNLFHVRLLVADRTNFEQVLVDFEYTDDEHDIHESGSMNISKESLNEPHEWVFPRADPARIRYRYNQLLIGSDGTVTAPGWVETDDSTLLVGKVYASRWNIRPELIGPPLAESGLEKIILTIDYDDPAHAYHKHNEQTFTAPGPGTPLALELRDPELRTYRYTVRYVQNTGFERIVGPRSSSDTFLVIPATPPPG